MVSKASDDLPEPETPETTVSLPCGISQSMPFRLWVRAPRIKMASFTGALSVMACGGLGCTLQYIGDWPSWRRRRRRELWKAPPFVAAPPRLVFFRPPLHKNG